MIRRKKVFLAYAVKKRLAHNVIRNNIRKPSTKIIWNSLPHSRRVRLCSYYLHNINYTHAHTLYVYNYEWFASYHQQSMTHYRNNTFINKSINNVKPIVWCWTFELIKTRTKHIRITGMHMIFDDRRYAQYICTARIRLCKTIKHQRKKKVVYESNTYNEIPVFYYIITFNMYFVFCFSFRYTKINDIWNVDTCC